MMTAATQTYPASIPPAVRPLDISRDLAQVADLVELAFAERLDSDGRRYIRQMRQAARNPGLLGLGSKVAPTFSGFVWEDAGRLVGNLNMLPVYALNQRAYLIANVAVHPKYRRQGIAQALTQAALETIARQGIRQAWLQADADNTAALELYQRLGFRERARRTTWHLLHLPATPPLLAVQVEPRRRADWIAQRRWLAALYPPAVGWHLPLDFKALDPGLRGALARLLNDKDLKQWAATRGGELLGVLTWQSSHLQADWLWLASAPEHAAAALQALVPTARAAVSSHRKLALDLPAGLETGTLADLGFQPHQTLVWMHLNL